MRYLSVAIGFLFYLPSFSQVFPPVSYPRDYFRDPLEIPMSLAANFGELRPNHYHMGLDIRTQHRENLRVVAAADGYIARIKVEPFGFGQAIYINHPNGYTTLYAHLNRFYPALAAYVEQQQYKAQSWELFIDIPAGLFPVKKGELIAYSGNRGGSQGPHLHFEIRRTAGDINLNPLLFGLPVPDNTPPVIQRLAIYDRRLSTYEQSPRILPVRRMAPGAPARAAAHSPAAAYGSAATVSSFAAYAITPGLVTVNSPRISFAISAFDTQSGSTNPNGIFQAILYDNDQLVTGFKMDRISYDNTRNINAHIDYKTRETGGPFLQHLSRLPGYPSPSIYRENGSDGVLDLSDGAPHNIRIEVKDAYGNGAVLQYQVQYRPAAGGAAQPMGMDKLRPIADGEGQAGGSQAGGSVGGSQAAAGDAGQGGKRFYPGMLDGVEMEDCAFYLGEKSLYDSVFIGSTTLRPELTTSSTASDKSSIPGAISAVHSIGAAYIPLLDPVLVRIRPRRDWMAEPTDKVVMVCSNRSGRDVRKPAWQGGWASARFGEFGNFQLVEDTAAPVITPIDIQDGADLSHSSRIAFTVKDNLGATLNFRAELDPPMAGAVVPAGGQAASGTGEIPTVDGRGGQWLCFTNDKEKAFIYTFDGHCPPGRHVLKVSVEDVAGNKTIRYYRFTR